LFLATLRFRRLPTLLLLGAAALFVPSLRADELIDKARVSEKRHDWLDACRCYDKSLRKDRDQPEVRDAYRRCLRRLYLVRRCEDRVYKEAVAKLTPSEALEVYDQVLVVVASAYVDVSKVDVNTLFQQGVQELRYDFDEDVFLREYLPGARPSAAARFKKILDGWAAHKVKSRTEAREEVLGLIQEARRADLDVKTLAVAFGLEFASGACNALDEYTLFLTPGYYNDVQAALQGKYVSIGVDVGASQDQGVEIIRVYPKSPAQEAGLSEHDRVVRIDHDVNLVPEAAAEKLRGEAGSMVEIEVRTPGQMMSRVIRLQRRPVYLPSVMDPQFLEVSTEMGTIPVGILQINHFTDSTVQDVKEALARLQTAGVKGLLLDLRGNPGGAFMAGVQVAELFLDEGVVVFAESPLDEYNRPFKVTARNPVQVPMVVLVDRDTASAAEVVAGALKEHRQGNTLIVGQTTFGKGSVQGVIPLDKPPLDKTPGGIRITVAKLFSPGKHLPYTGRGVTPDIVVEQNGDPTTAGLEALVQLIKSGMMMR
jgi:carboxyl-terminal processing protease